MKIISCSNNFTHVKVKNILHPSELNSTWLKKTKIKKKYNQYLIYIDLITDLYQYKIYSKYEIGITLLGITLIDNVLIHNSITNIYKLNIIQINTNLIEHSYIDKSFNNKIEKLYNLI